MLKEQMNKFISIFKLKKENINNNDKDNKENINIDTTNRKKIENIVVFIIILIVTIVIINMIWNESKNGNNTDDKNTDKVLAKTNNKEFNIDSNENVISEDELEQKLKIILAKIEGVGNVDVLITYSQSSQVVTLYDEDTTQSITEEVDTSGGNRKINESNIKKEIIYKEEDGKKVPVTQSVIKPKIEGAVIIAKRSNKYKY